jgi:hypothetical protein
VRLRLMLRWIEMGGPGRVVNPAGSSKACPTAKRVHAQWAKVVDTDTSRNVPLLPKPARRLGGNQNHPTSESHLMKASSSSCPFAHHIKRPDDCIRHASRSPIAIFGATESCATVITSSP